MPKKVLIVEDNELNMKLFRDLLEAHGYQTIESRDGCDAGASCRSGPSMRLQYLWRDLAFTRMGGLGRCADR